MTFSGYIMSAIKRALSPASDVTITGHQTNGAYCIHQAKVTLEGDPNTYRLIIAPADAPIQVNGRPIHDHFLLPLGDR